MEHFTQRHPRLTSSKSFIHLLMFCLFSVTSLVLSSFHIPSSSLQSAYNKSVKNELPFFAKLTTSIQVIGQQVRSQGSGTATHLGKTTFEVQATVNFAVQPAQVTGTAIFTAANGDQFFTSFIGVTSPNGLGAVIGDFTHEITGGTGRFANSSGTLTGHSVHQIGLQSGSLEFQGMIDY